MCDKELILCTLGTSVSTALPALDRVVNASVQVLVRSRSGVQKGIFGFRHHHSHTLEKSTFRQHSMDSNLSCTALIMKDFMLDRQTLRSV